MVHIDTNKVQLTKLQVSQQLAVPMRLVEDAAIDLILKGYVESCKTHVKCWVV